MKDALTQFWGGPKLAESPLLLRGTQLVVAMADPFDVMAMDQLRRYLPRGVQIEARVCMEDDLVNAIDRNFGYEMSVAGILRELETGEFDVSAATEREGYAHPLVRLVDALLSGIKRYFAKNPPLARNRQL